MNANAYEILALAMRYVFAGLMVLIVLRALVVTMVDSKRATQLRRLNPKTGIIGEFLVMESAGWARRGMRYPVTLEGCIGASSRADIRIRRNGLHARHAYFQMTKSGLYVRGHANITLRDEDGDYVRERILSDGDILYIGKIELMLVLHDGSAAAPSFTIEKKKRRENKENEDIFVYGTPEDAENEYRDPYDDPEGDFAEDFFLSNPAANRRLYNTEESFDDYEN